ncbi:MAG: leucine-rich repeat domain-containing protein [Lachnospiraceae bacterium]|nr:leucine-rich repeat domain-containing protein [Lachnospiraceae bacterium]
MKKIKKITALSVCMALVLNLQVFSVFGEEIPLEPEIGTEADAGVDVESDEDVLPEAEEKLGDVEYKYSKPYEGAAYELKYHIMDDQTICIDGYTGEVTGELIIPSEIDGKAVTEIGSEAFLGCSGFTGSLTIPASVTKIDRQAFVNCTGFNGSLIIPDGVTSIGLSAFAECSGFTGSLTIPASLIDINEGVFFGCSGFTGNLTIPDSVTTIGEGAFYNCSGFTENLTIPDSVMLIREDAFSGCSGFTGKLTIGKNAGSFEDGQFTGCNGFRKVVNRSDQEYILPPGPDGQYWIDAATGETITKIRSGMAIRSDRFDPVNAPLFTHDAAEEQTYTGKAIKPAVNVYFGTSVLEEKKDYTITYRNNTNAGTATFTVTGKGNYTGSDSDSFKILKKNIDADDVSFTMSATAKYTKKEQIPVPKITYNGMTLKKDKDFTVACYSDEAYSEWCVPAEPGTYYIRVTGIGNYEGEVKTTFVIADPKRKLMSSLKADKIADKNYANGEKITLAANEPVIRDGSKILIKGQDYYEITDSDYTDNIYPGTARVTVRGIDKAGYTGTLTVTFKITGTPINKAEITGLDDVTYNGTDQKPEPVVKLNGTTLTKDEDYELIYEKNKNVGKAKVTIKGSGGYTGSVSRTFTIKPVTIMNGMISLDQEEPYPYAGSGVKPAVTVIFNGTTLSEGKDYTVKYTNNTAVKSGSETNKPTVSITGKGNFTGKEDVCFTIKKADISTCDIVVDDVIYKNIKGNWKPKKISVTGPDGKALKAGKDYDDKTIRYTSDVEGMNEILADASLDAGNPVYVWIKAKDTNYTGTVMGIYRIVAQDIGKLTATLDPKAYTGKEVKLNKGDIKWKSGTKTVTGVSFYLVENSYKNNVNKGKATVVVKGTGNYGGTKTITFTIGSKGIKWWWRNLFN